MASWSCLSSSYVHMTSFPNLFYFCVPDFMLLVNLCNYCFSFHFLVSIIYFSFRMYIICSAPVFFYQMFILLFTTLFLYLLFSFFPPEIVRWDIHSSLEHKKKITWRIFSPGTSGIRRNPIKIKLNLDLLPLSSLK